MQATIERYLPRFIMKYVGNRHFFNAAAIKKLEGSSKFVAKANDILYLAPVMKWGLSIVPITLTLTGGISPASVDVKQSSSLALTGVVWTFYGIALSANNPGMFSLVLVNAAMALVNGFNAYRGYNFQYGQKPALPEATPQAH